jgi:hypothetical protein
MSDIPEGSQKSECRQPGNKPRSDPTTQTENIDEELLCEDCSSVPWEELMRPKETRSITLPTLRQEIYDLEASNCRMCRFLGTVMGLYEEPSNFPSPPFTVQLVKELTVEGECFVILCLKSETHWLRKKRPQILMSNATTETSSDALGHHVVGEVPIKLLKNQFTTCKRDHGPACCPKDASVL